MNTGEIVDGLKAEKAKIQRVIDILTAKVVEGRAEVRKMSAAQRQRLSEIAKERWKKARKNGKHSL